MIFFSLFSTAISSIFYGIVVTAAVMVLLYFGLQAFNKYTVRGPLFYAVGVVMALLLVIQFSLMIGAVNTKDAVDAAELFLQQQFENVSGTVSALDSQRVLDMITEEYPIIGSYMDTASFPGHDIQDLPAAMHETMTDYLNSYIWHRVFWIVGIIIVAVIIVVLATKPGQAAGGTDRRGARSSRHDGHRVSTATHRRASRR